MINKSIYVCNSLSLSAECLRPFEINGCLFSAVIRGGVEGEGERRGSSCLLAVVVHSREGVTVFAHRTGFEFPEDCPAANPANFFRSAVFDFLCRFGFHLLITGKLILNQSSINLIKKFSVGDFFFCCCLYGSLSASKHEIACGNDFCPPYKYLRSP